MLSEPLHIFCFLCGPCSIKGKRVISSSQNFLFSVNVYIAAKSCPCVLEIGHGLVNTALNRKEQQKLK
jgi:hypothetical protein